MNGSERVRGKGWTGAKELDQTDRRSPGPRVRRLLGVAGLGAGMTLMGCSHPAVFDSRTELSPRSAQSCVVQNLVDHGYRITDNNRRDGLVRAERQGTFLGFALHDEFDMIEVVIYERDYGETSIQYTASRVEYEHGGAEFRGPRGDVEETAREIAYLCSGER